MGANVRCEYILTGAFDPALVSSATGIQANRVWRFGDPISSKGDRTYKFDGWMKSIDYEPCADVEVPLQKLLDTLRPAQQMFANLIQEHGLKAEICIAMKVTDEELPATTIGVDLVSEIAALRAGIDIDIILMA